MKRPSVARLLVARKVLDHAQEDVLAQVLEVDRRRALAIDRAEDQGATEVHQVPSATLLARLNPEQQAMPGPIRDGNSTSPGQAIFRDLVFF
jgi:hypothetical protein